MKFTPRLLLAASVVVNVALFATLIGQRSYNVTPAPELTPTPDRAADSAQTDPSNRTPATDTWKTLSAGNEPSDWVKNLRAAGFPNTIINAVVTARIRERYAARRAELQEKNDQQYWSKAWNNWGGGDPETRAAIRALWKEEREAIKLALGDAYADSPEYQRMVQRQFGSIPKEKISALQTITEDYQELTSEIHQSTNGFMLPEDREKLAYLEKEKRADLAAILTPQELLDFELRTSQTANNLRWQLGAFSPSEQEFKSIFTLQRDFDLTYPNNRSNTDETARQARAAAESALMEQLKATLGEARYAEYQRAKDHNYQQLANLTERLALPKENAIAVYDLSKEIEKRAQQIRSDKNLKPDARNEALAALADEANAKVVASLGDRGAEAYKENGGWWLRNLAPRPVPKPAANK